MKIHCKRADLLQGVQTIQAALSPRTTLPILLNFLMETEEKRVKLVSTDLEMGMKHFIPAEVESGGSITVPARKFSDIIHSLEEGHDVDVSVDVGGKVRVHCGRSKFILAGSPKSEYPVIQEASPEAAFQVPAKTLHEMLRKTTFAASTDETRYVLNGVFWVASNGTLDLAATDGRRLAVIRRSCVPKDRQFRVIVPTKVLNEILKLIGAPDGNGGGEDKSVTIAVTESQIVFGFQDTTVISRLVEGSFPNYEQVIPSKRDIQVGVSGKELRDITKRASLCAAERGGGVRFTFKPKALHVSAASQNHEFDEEMPLEYGGDELSIGFNPQYVMDGLKNIGSDRIKMSLTTAGNPVLVETPEDEHYWYVVMPMRA